MFNMFITISTGQLSPVQHFWQFTKAEACSGCSPLYQGFCSTSKKCSQKKRSAQTFLPMFFVGRGTHHHRTRLQARCSCPLVLKLPPKTPSERWVWSFWDVHGWMSITLLHGLLQWRYSKKTLGKKNCVYIYTYVCMYMYELCESRI